MAVPDAVDEAANASVANSVRNPYRALLGIRPFRLVSTSMTISTFGDACFNVVVMWTVFA